LSRSGFGKIKCGPSLHLAAEYGVFHGERKMSTLNILRNGCRAGSLVAAGVILPLVLAIAIAALGAARMLPWQRAEVMAVPVSQPIADVTVANMSVADIVKATRLGIGRIEARTPIVNADGVTGRMTETGTGFLIDRNGDMVTNCHVVSKPDEIDRKIKGPTVIEVSFPDAPDTHLSAVVKGCDTPGDIAVLKLNDIQPWRKPLRFADAKTIEVGQEAITIGFAEGITGDPTVARGIVSALHRSFFGGAVSDLVQTDATINHGNSGGPLLNLRGEVVGVNTYTTALSLKLGDRMSTEAGEEAVPVSTTGANIYFARSAASASRYVDAIIATGRVERPSLGLSVSSLSPEKYRLPQQGVLVSEVAAKGQGSLAFEYGDIVTSITWSNGYRYATPNEGAWNDALSMIRPGETVTLHYYRLTDSGVQAAVALREAAAADVNWLQVKMTAPGRRVAQALPAGTMAKTAIPGFKS
jgi:S1-C subfamily serine protease